MVLRRYSPNFFKRSHAFERLLDSHHSQSFHSLRDCLVLDHRSRSAFDNQSPDRFAHWERFNQRRTSEITAAFATIASGSVIEHSVFLLTEAELLDQFRLRHELFLTIRADAPNESLRARHQDRAGN